MKRKRDDEPEEDIRPSKRRGIVGSFYGALESVSSLATSVADVIYNSSAYVANTVTSIINNEGKQEYLYLLKF